MGRHGIKLIQVPMQLPDKYGTIFVRMYLALQYFFYVLVRDPVVLPSSTTLVKTANQDNDTHHARGYNRHKTSQPLEIAS